MATAQSSSGALPSPIHQPVQATSSTGGGNIRSSGEGQPERSFIQLEEIGSPTNSGDRGQVSAVPPVLGLHGVERGPEPNPSAPVTTPNGIVPESTSQSPNTDGIMLHELDVPPQRDSLHPKPIPNPPDEDIRGGPTGAFLKWVLLTLLIISIALNIALSVPGGILRRPSRATPAPNLTVTTLAATDEQPVLDSSLGATAIVLSVPFTLNPENETKLVYNSNSGKICIRTKSKGHWRANIQCVEGANPKNNTPLTMLDWLGGPSIYFFTAKNRLSGIDYIPKNDSWRLSSIAGYGITVHDQSHLASVTWRNGTSAWLYYQLPDLRIWELGMEDYRDWTWNNGPTGEGLGKAAAGSATGQRQKKYFSQRRTGLSSNGGTPTQRGYQEQSIKGTADKLKVGATISASTVRAPVGDTVVLAYMSKIGFLEVQTRGTANVSDYTDYSPPIEIVEGNAHLRTGVAIVDLDGIPTVYFVNGRQIVEASGPKANSSTGNWTWANI
ncbi:MAG: hypothetical protein M1840_008143 [Geoglossum simile]|nr:MAG: hypothetical protein M1840_008143 [Geoglossum simile]